MSGYDEYDEQNEQNNPGNLRKALEKALKEKAELQEKYASLEGKVNEFSLASVLSEKKVPASIQRWMKKDGVEPTAEAVDNWLNENGADFGWKPGGTEGSEGATAQEAPAQEPQAPAQQSVLDSTDIAELQRQQDAFGGGSSQPAYPLDKLNEAVERVAGSITPQTSYEDVAKQLAALGVPIVGERSI